MCIPAALLLYATKSPPPGQLYSIDGNDLYVKVRATMDQIRNEETIVITTPEGEQVKVKLPRQFHPGDRLRMRAAYRAGAGDIYVVLGASDMRGVMSVEHGP
jgi:DnaJ-class molecular chaperone